MQKYTLKSNWVIHHKLYVNCILYLLQSYGKINQENMQMHESPCSSYN